MARAQFENCRLYLCIAVIGAFVIRRRRASPLQVPQDIVFGDAWQPPHIEEPTRDEVDAAHAVFVEKLTRLFDAHKPEFGLPQQEARKRDRYHIIRGRPRGPL